MKLHAGLPSIVSYPAEAEALLEAFNRLSALDSDATFISLKAIVPKGESISPELAMNAAAAKAMLDLWQKYKQGQEVTDEMVAGLTDPFTEIPATNVREDSPKHDGDEAAQWRGGRKRMRGANHPLPAKVSLQFEFDMELLKTHKEVVVPIVKVMVTSKQVVDFNLSKLMETKESVLLLCGLTSVTGGWERRCAGRDVTSPSGRNFIGRPLFLEGSFRRKSQCA